MKINTNMALGQAKQDLLQILIEPDPARRALLYKDLEEMIFGEKVPIRPGRHNPRSCQGRSRHPVNKRNGI